MINFARDDYVLLPRILVSGNDDFFFFIAGRKINNLHFSATLMRDSY